MLSERWEKPGDITRYKGLNNKVNTQANNRFVADESTFIWRNINIQYDFPRRICKYLKMERLSLSASMMDLLYLSTIEQERGTNYPYSVKPSFSLSCTFVGGTSNTTDMKSSNTSNSTKNSSTKSSTTK